MTRKPGFLLAGRSVRGGRVRRGVLLLLAAALFGASALSSAAATWYVDQSNGSDANAGDDWGAASAWATIAHAVTTAGASDTINVAAGTYASGAANGMAVSGQTIVGGYPAGGGGARDWTANPTILDGGGTQRAFSKSGSTTFTLDGLTVRNGFRLNTAGGAGIYCTAGSLDIRNCVFTNNNAAGDKNGCHGGAVYQSGAGAENIFSNCTFMANNAGTYGSGGAVYLGGGGTNIFANCEFVANTAPGGSTSGSVGGGAIYAAGGLLVVSDCVFSNNVATSKFGYGGAINSAGALDLSGGNNLFTGNRSGNERSGGAICQSGAGFINVFSNCTFMANNGATYGNGGAVYLVGEGCTNVFGNCEFVANTTANGSGGAIYLGASVLNVVNCTFLGNRSSNAQGGAIRAGAASAVLNVTNCIFRNNTAGSTGDEIQNDGTLNLSYSCINTNAGYVDGGTRNFGSGIINTNPLFVSESEPYDVHLQSTMGRYSNGVWVVDAVMSPCIDAGDNSPYSNEPEPNGNKINMGRYGNTAEASKSLAIRITNDGGVSNLTDSSTVVNGYLDYGADPLNYIWIYWGPTDGGTNKNAWTNCVPMNGHTTGSTFSTNVSGLISGSVYWYRCYGSNSYGDAWASSSTVFETLSQPVVTHSGASGITAFSARLKGALTEGSQAYIWIYWGTSDGETTAGNWGHTNSLGLLNEGAFLSMATGLQDGATYYYRCYASNEIGTAWASATTNFVAEDIAGPGQIWDGGGEDDDWSTSENWVGDVMPGRPATSVVTFNSGGAEAQGVVSSVLDADWTLNGGLTFANTAGNYHTLDLGGNTLLVAGDVMLGGNVLTPQVTIDGAVADSVFQIGQNGTLRNLTIGWYASGSGELALSGGMFVAYLDEISVAYNTVNSGTSVIGVFDLRDTTYHSNTFEANTLRVGVGRLATGTLRLDDGAGGITAVKANTTLHLGNGIFGIDDGTDITVGVFSGDTPVTRGNLYVGYITGYHGNSGMSLVPTGGTLRAYLDNVIAGGYTYYNAGGTGSGVLDLRNTTYYTNVFEANSIRVGYSQRAVGTLRLDDGPGGITAVQANNELHLGNGSFVLDEGTDITIGTFTNGVPDTRGNLYVGYAEGGYQNGASMTFAPTGGTFSAYLNNLYVGRQSYTTAGGTSGTLDLTAVGVVNDISILNFVIGSGRGAGTVILPACRVTTQNLIMDSGGTYNSGLLKLIGTDFTVGDAAASTFAIEAGGSHKIELDLANPNTRLRVYGDYQAAGSGPATNISAYLADGRIVVTNDTWNRVEVYYDAPFSIVGLRPVNGPVLIVR